VLLQPVPHLLSVHPLRLASDFPKLHSMRRSDPLSLSLSSPFAKSGMNSSSLPSRSLPSAASSPVVARPNKPPQPPSPKFPKKHFVGTPGHLRAGSHTSLDSTLVVFRLESKVMKND
jgi:hypothetical protein